jgi:fimbrial chaperone protein
MAVSRSSFVRIRRHGWITQHVQSPMFTMSPTQPGSRFYDPTVSCLLGVNLATIVLLLGFFLSSAAYAQKASLFIHPTKIEMAQKSRGATVHITNRGNATGTFSISWVDMLMDEAGGISVQKQGSAWSLQPWVRYSPRRITLAPGQSQVIKVAVNRRKKAPTKEFFSHLKVLTLNSNVGSVDASKTSSLNNAATVTARSAMAIPVIWRNLNEPAEAIISDVNINTTESTVTVRVKRLGEASTRGYLQVYATDARKITNRLIDPIPVIIYPNIQTRHIKIDINDRLSRAIRDGRLHIVYARDVDDQAQPYAVHNLPPS